MPKASRRDFLLVTGTGTVAAGVLAALPGSADAATPLQAPRDAKPMLVHIADPDGAELHIHTGENSTVVRDRELVIRLQRATGKLG